MNELIMSNKLIASFLLILIAAAIRWLVIRYLRKMPTGDSDSPRRWMNGVRNLVTTFVIVSLIIIWLSELRFVALSIATFTVALIIATREFIQCFLGALYQTSARAFSIGDWIKVGNNYGEVVSSDWLTTKLLEIDMDSMSYGYTGKTLIISNNQFLSSSIQNLNFMRRYVAHTFTIIRDPELLDIFQAKDRMLEMARNYSRPYSEVAQHYHDMLEERSEVKLPRPEPRVRITTTQLGKNQFTITIFCPTCEAVKIEQKLTEDFMKFWYAEVERLTLEREEKKAYTLKQAQHHEN